MAVALIATQSGSCRCANTGREPDHYNLYGVDMAIQNNTTTNKNTQFLRDLGEQIARQRRELAASMREHRQEQQRLRKVIREHLEDTHS